MIYIYIYIYIYICASAWTTMCLLPRNLNNSACRWWSFWSHKWVFQCLSSMVMANRPWTWVCVWSAKVWVAKLLLPPPLRRHPIPNPPPHPTSTFSTISRNVNSTQRYCSLPSCLNSSWPGGLVKMAIFNTILMSPKSWLSQEFGCRLWTFNGTHGLLRVLTFNF